MPHYVAFHLGLHCLPENQFPVFKGLISWILEPFGDVVTNSPKQLSSRTHFAIISNKKNIPKINVKKQKKGV